VRTGNYLLLILGFFFIASCKKDKNEPVVIKDFTMEALTTKSWKPVGTDGNPAVNPPAGTYVYYALGEWSKDDVITYKSDFRVYYDYGSILPQITIELPSSKEYSVDFAKKTITIGGITYRLLELSASRLKYSRASGGGNPDYVFMFEHL